MAYIIQVKHKDNTWEVWWDGTRVYDTQNKDGESYCWTFANALEMGIVGSKINLGANSKIKWPKSYVSAFDSYEDFANPDW